MNYLDLFSGIGGFPLGLYNAGLRFDTHYFSEVEKYCLELYAKRFPDAIGLGDITKIYWHEIKSQNKGEWFVTGGFPCQPHSTAGKRKGSEDERDLWGECRRVLRDIQPRIALFENVSGLFVSERGAFFNRVLTDIHEVGYDAEWAVIPASFVGAPHRRDRVWIIAYPNKERLQRRQNREQSKDSLRKEYADNFRQPVQRDTARTSANSDETEQGLNTRTNSKAQEALRRRNESDVFTRQAEYVRDSQRTGFAGVFDGQGQIKYGGTGERFSWGNEHWTQIATRLCRVDDGISGRVDRLSGLGNAVVPQVVELIGRMIKDTL